MDTIGGRIRAELVRLNLTMRDAAEPLGVSKSQVSKLCRGTADLDVPTLMALVRLSGRSADYFLTGRETIPALPEDVRRVADQYLYLRDVKGLTVTEAIDRLSTPAPAVPPPVEPRLLGSVDLTEHTRRRIADRRANRGNHESGEQ